MWFYFKNNTITFQSVPKSPGSKRFLHVNLPYEAKSVVKKINLAVQVHQVLISHVKKIKKIIDMENADEQTDSFFSYAYRAQNEYK